MNIITGYETDMQQGFNCRAATIMRRSLHVVKAVSVSWDTAGFETCLYWWGSKQPELLVKSKSVQQKKLGQPTNIEQSTHATQVPLWALPAYACKV